MNISLLSMKRILETFYAVFFISFIFKIKDKINEALSVPLICVISLNKNDKCAFKYIGGKQDNNTNCSHDMT